MPLALKSNLFSDGTHIPPILQRGLLISFSQVSLWAAFPCLADNLQAFPPFAFQRIRRLDWFGGGKSGSLLLQPIFEESHVSESVLFLPFSSTPFHTTSLHSCLQSNFDSDSASFAFSCQTHQLWRDSSLSLLPLLSVFEAPVGEAVSGLLHLWFSWNSLNIYSSHWCEAHFDFGRQCANKSSIERREWMQGQRGSVGSFAQWYCFLVQRKWNQSSGVKDLRRF